MNLRIFFSLFLLISGMILPSQTAQATHIRAGEIIAERISDLRYRFTIRMYFDTCPFCADSPTLDVDFGTGEDPIRFARTNSFPVAGVQETSVNEYIFEHTFPSPGRFRVSFIERNRNDGIINVNNSNSVDIPFSVETIITISPILGANSTPNFTIAPLDQACVGQRFTHNPGAFDVDGDSIAYRLAIPKQNVNDVVPNYLDPNDSSFGQGTEADSTLPAEFSIDPITGTVTWDAPTQSGEYNLAFVVEEWRSGVLIGEVVRDMQVIVNECNNRRPDLTPLSICAVANEIPGDTSNVIFEPIIATDPDGDEIEISVSNAISEDGNESIDQGIFDSDVFDVTAELFPTTQINDTTYSAIFRWDTRCEHVREQPYYLVIRAKDIPNQGPGALVQSLVDVETWQIQVKGPPPIQFNAQLDDRAANLSWQDYRLQCPSFNNFDFSTMDIIIWRREGCGMRLMCEQDPTMFGYTEIGRVGVDDTTFRDDGPLARGLTYSYVLTVNYPQPTRGTSLASEEACVSLPLTAPLITNVNVDQTDALNGQISLRWIFPPELDTSLDVGPYSYILERADGIAGTNFTSLASNLNDTSFVDTGLNTQNQAYTYRVTIRGNGGSDTLAQSDPASSVRLSTTPSENSIILTWDYQVPWSNNTLLDRGVPGHIIFRKESTETSFIAIDTVVVGIPTYTDFGAFNNQCLDPNLSYEYRVTTLGSYYNDLLMPRVDALDRPLFNDSQESGPISPLNEIAPPPPVLQIDSADCSALLDKICADALPANFTTDPSNTLFWNRQTSGGNGSCDDVAFYQLFYRAPGQSDYDFSNPIYQGPDTTFTHSNLERSLGGLRSQAGCYLLISIDQSGNASLQSEEICQDNCLYYELPNVLTPDNRDGINDVFRPCQDPLYAESVEFEVFNRWGNSVYTYQGDPQFSWDATDDSGKDIPPGVYYYSANVRFLSIDPDRANQVLKGWIRVIRTDGSSSE